VGDPSVWRGYPTKRGFDFFHGYVRHADGHYHYPKEDKIQLWENEREISADAAGSYTTDLFTARAKRWIVDHRQANADQPFFLFLAYDTPHAKLQRLPGPYPDGGGLKGGVQWTGQPGALLNTSATAKPDTWLYPEHTEAKYDHDQDPATPAVPWPEVYQRYASSVKRIDECVGDLRLLLRDLGIERDTLVVFTSDNGPAAESYLKENFSPEFFGGFGPFDGLKRDLLEGGWRVPTFAAWPAAITAGRELTQPSAHSDWMPTLSALAGVPAPARTDGMALSELWGEASDAAPTPRTIYSEFKVNGRTPPYASFETARRGRTRGQMQALRVGDFVGVRYDVKSADAPFEIFDATKDPKQLRDLAKDPAHASLQAEFQARALQSRRPYPANPTVWDALPVPGVEVPAGAARELSWARYLGEFPWVPETRGLSPSALGTTERFTGAQLGETSGAMKFTGYLVVPTEGDYTFTVAAPGGAVLRLHETTVIDADFGYVAGEERSGAIRLAAGHHPFTLTVRRDHKSTGDLSVTWAGPELSRRALTATDFAR
jgi:arylsulfatase A-like enzyme